MKTQLFKLAIILTLCTFAYSCEKSEEPLPQDFCWVILNITPGEETLLLARRAGSDYKKRDVILSDFITTYGVENIKFETHTPASPVKRNKTAYCYEISATVELSENYHPPVENLLKYSWWSVVKYLDDRTITGKIYLWRYSEEVVGKEVEDHDRLLQDWGQGKIISSSIENLGTYIENMPITF